MLQPVHGFDRYFLITFQNHHGMTASSGTIELHRRNVDRLMLQHGRHLRDMSRLILIVNNQSRIIAAEIRRQTVKLCDHDPAASHGGSYDFQLSAGF